ncbi:unnamed protein product [Microthlaspi erraticum]|uniref:Retrotransposon gag domain-containing protein n=1 Tax=Microthlaspi erraticum TaxID=1685480 RepID=A0A6D2JUW1_9BRAS|nr:unnamed protein product [Microthlaspi erraticum]
MAKIAKTGPGGSIEKSRPNERNSRPRNIRPAVGQHPNARPSRLNNGRANVPIREATSRGRPNQITQPKPRHDRTARTESIASRPCGTTHVPRPIAPSDQEGLVPRPAESFDQNHPSGRTRRTNAKTLGHDRSDVPIADHDSTAGRTSRPTVRTRKRQHGRERYRAGRATRDPPDLNAAHDRANGGMPRNGLINEEVMGDSINPTLLVNRNPIQPPLPGGRSYEISPEIIALVKQNQFQGKPQENPLEHIDAFEEICGTISAVEHPRSHFFTKQRANLLREKISSFQQGPVEPFHEALERFKDYTRECPNHGLSDGSLWNIFYRGISGKCRFSLDTASNGNFMTKTVTEAKILIENLASSDSDNFIGHEEQSRP